jgi:hypothetical protein
MALALLPTRPRFVLRCYPPLGTGARLTTHELSDGDIDGLSFGSSLSGGIGGFDTLTVTFAYPYAPREGVYPARGRQWWHALFPSFGHVELWVDGARVWEGRRIQVSKDRGFVTGITARGYAYVALDDAVFTSTSTTGVTSLGILQAVLAAAAPAIAQATGPRVFDPGIGHTLAEFTLKMPSQIVNQLAQEGGAGDDAWDFVVGLDRIPSFTPRLPPSLPDYHIGWGPAITTYLEDDSDVYGAVTVQYTDLTSGASAVTPTFIDNTFGQRYRGFLRGAVVNASGSLSAASAAQFARTYLGTHGYSRVSAKLQYTGGEGPEQAVGGASQYPWLVSAGEWVQIGEELPSIIIRAQYDAGSAQLDLDLGLPLPYGLAELVHAFRIADQHYVNGTSPLTGASR